MTIPGERARESAQDVLVDCNWLAARLGDPRLVPIEVDEQPLLYRMGHIPGAFGVDWKRDLQDPVTRDLPDPGAVRRLWRRLGIRQDSLVVLYGDKNNWYACFAYWLFKLYGLEGQRVLDGGRPLWVSRGLPLTREEPLPDATEPPQPRLDPRHRAGWWNVPDLAVSDGCLVDVRSPEEYRGELLTEPGYPEEVAQRPGHIPGAINIPWAQATEHDGAFRSPDDLRALYGSLGALPERPIITYCRIGERSAHTWFVLHELLGYNDVRNYDGSWTEWGSMMGMPVALGEEAGAFPSRAPSPLGLDRRSEARARARARA